jgi:hypothetical protein
MFRPGSTLKYHVGVGKGLQALIRNDLHKHDMNQPLEQVLYCTYIALMTIC